MDEVAARALPCTPLKAFVHNLTRHLARDLAPRGIRVNTVYGPGVIATPFHAATPPERMEAMRKSVLLGRVGTPADVVGAFLFLASPALSGYHRRGRTLPRERWTGDAMSYLTTRIAGACLLLAVCAGSPRRGHAST